MNKKDGRQQNGHRLGWVTSTTWVRMKTCCDAKGITANDLTIMAIDAYLLEWERTVGGEDDERNRRETVQEGT